jgi:predicted SprT family Zn-dependent metalloprotease
MKDQKKSITTELYTTLDDAYSFFNDMLFENSLPQVIIVLQRKGKNNLGYFHPERYADREQMNKAVNSKAKKKKTKLDTVSELSLNPDNFLWYSDKDILATLVHEMCHVWQHYLAEKKSRGGYHDKVWGKKMKEIGLHPSNTGEKDGKETGQQMHHYIIKGGKFDLHVEQLLKSKKLFWNSMPLLKAASKKKDKTKYICPSCDAKVWGKPSMNILCIDCEEQFQEV